MLSPIEPSRDVRALREVLDLPVVAPAPNKVAVLLNRNARRVDDALATRIERIVGKENLYYSRTLEEAEGFAREIVQRGYGTVVCGGGDGTLVQAVNLVLRYIDEANAWRVQRFRRFGERQTLLGKPRFAFLPLGTGNAVRGLVGATSPLDDLRRVVDYVPSRTTRVPLIELDGERFFFAGLGYDSLILNDYNGLKQHAKHPLVKPMMQNVLGYFAAIFSRTLPSVLTGRAGKLSVRVTNAGEGFYVDPRRGDFAQPLETGAAIFEGPATFVGVGTMPFYGYGFKMFPFAGMMPGKMHLRVGRIGPFRTLAHLPSFWKGSFRDPNRVFDFLVDHVRIELDRPFPFQHSGDAQGERTELDLRVSPEAVELIDLHRPRQLTF